MKKLLYIMLIVNCSLPIVKSQWTQLPNLPVSGMVWDMYFINQTTGWMTLQSPTSIIKTTDGGLNWVVQSNNWLRELQFIDSSLGYATGFVGTNGVLWKTTDGGANWNSTFTTNVFTDLFFANKDTGWFSGGDGFLGGVWHTTDGGVSFQRQMTSSTGSLDRIFFLKEKINGQYVGWTLAVPVLYKTTNSGINWIQVYNGFTSQCTSAIDMYFVDSANGIITRGNKCLNKTNDGGYNWSTINEYNVSTCSHITMANNQVGWITISADSIIKTTNFFQSYGKQVIPAYACKIFALDTSIVYGALNMTNIIKTTNGGGNIVSVQMISSDVPGNFKLCQNYPNPFNPKTTVEFSISKSTFINFKIYDILGRMVIEVYNNKYIHTGIYKLDLDFSSYLSGVYFYTLQTEDFRETKKLIYVK